MYERTFKEPIVHHKDSEHETVNFIDDSNSVINFKDEDLINYYVDSYMKVLKTYYNIMRLKLNPGKTNIMIVCKRRRRHEMGEIQIVDGTEQIKTKNQIKILGLEMNNQIEITGNTMKL